MRQRDRRLECRHIHRRWCFGENDELSFFFPFNRYRAPWDSKRGGKSDPGGFTLTLNVSPNPCSNPRSNTSSQIRTEYTILPGEMQLERYRCPHH